MSNVPFTGTTSLPMTGFSFASNSKEPATPSASKRVIERHLRTSYRVGGSPNTI